MTTARKTRAHSARTHSNKSLGILVVGDWMVDQHWVVGEHRAVSSSRTGTDHSRALHGADCSVRTLCGAGQVATILLQAATQPPIDIELYGMGIWHREDSAALEAMLNPTNNVGITPH